jgi:hypothetical protein
MPNELIAAGSPAWVLLSVIYHHVLAQSPSPEAAKIAISTARQDGRLRLRAEVREHKPIPGRLNPGEQPAQIFPKCDLDQPILANDKFSNWNWERSYASRRNTTNNFLFEYVNIVGNRDDVLRLWPRAEPTVDIPKVASVKPKDISGLVWATVVTLDNMEKNSGGRVIRPDAKTVDRKGQHGASENSLRENAAKSRGLSSEEREISIGGFMRVTGGFRRAWAELCASLANGKV